VTPLVIDGSAILSFLLIDERKEAAEHVLDIFQKSSDWSVLAPSHFWMEVANGLLMAERRKRASPLDVADALQLLFELKIATDDETKEHCRGESLSLAREYNLTLYDAAYLELAIRRRAGLATLDRALQRAAHARGVRIIS
jgi:predicted nucleic acid-binding protein